jgi:hypothetical protein
MRTSCSSQTVIFIPQIASANCIPSSEDIRVDKNYVSSMWEQIWSWGRKSWVNSRHIQFWWHISRKKIAGSKFCTTIATIQVWNIESQDCDSYSSNRGIKLTIGKVDSTGQLYMWWEMMERRSSSARSGKGGIWVYGEKEIIMSPVGMLHLWGSQCIWVNLSYGE